VDTFDSLNQAISNVDKWDSPIHSIRHIVKLSNGKFAIMGHINCETCKYCEECYELKNFIRSTKYWCSGPHNHKEKIYD
jgi:hypothetical protein